MIRHKIYCKMVRQMDHVLLFTIKHDPYYIYVILNKSDTRLLFLFVTSYCEYYISCSINHEHFVLCSMALQIKK